MWESAKSTSPFNADGRLARVERREGDRVRQGELMAELLGIFIYASPAIILSGFAAPVENMPWAVEWLSRLDPARYMLVISRGVFLQAMPASVTLNTIWPMAATAAGAMAIAAVAVRRAVA
jgi:ABC-type multidrug transport system permease subunit